MRIAAMVSGGKDSYYAIYKAKEKNEIICLISIKSENPDSYMFHTPNIDLVELQAEAMELPLLIHKTKGEKEIELKDLKDAIIKAKEEFNIEGILTGALFSKYQKERIDNICNELELASIAPLWHMNQEKEMREIIKDDFKIIFSSIAGFGFTKDLLGKIITDKDIDKLVELNKKYKINIAGEGGEFESLVLDCPLFKKEIIIKDSKIIEENESTAKFLVKEAILKNK